MRGIAIGSETNFAASEAVHELEGGIIARFPRIPDLKRRLPLIDVTRAVNAVTPVYLMTTVDAVAADEAVQARSDCFHRIHGFAQDPYLNHVSGFPVVAGCGKTGGDNDSFGVFVENEAVAHSTPPTMNSATMMANTEIMNAASARKARAVRKDLRVFIRCKCSDIGAHAK